MQDISFTFLNCTIISLFTLLSNSSTANRKMNFVFLSHVYLFLSLYVLQGNTGKNAIFHDNKSADKNEILHLGYICVFQCFRVCMQWPHRPKGIWGMSKDKHKGVSGKVVLLYWFPNRMSRCPEIISWWRNSFICFSTRMWESKWSSSHHWQSRLLP